MRLPLFTGYPDGSITGKPGLYSNKPEVLCDNKKFRITREKDGTLTVKIKKQ